MKWLQMIRQDGIKIHAKKELIWIGPWGIDRILIGRRYREGVQSTDEGTEKTWQGLFVRSD